MDVWLKIMFEEIDQLINKLKSEEEIYNYVNKNIYPERLKFSHMVKYIPPIKETKFPEIALEDISKIWFIYNPRRRT